MKFDQDRNTTFKFTIGAILIGIVTLVVYVLTLCPTIYVGDSGELIAASWSMGVPHSPGYPLFTFIGHFFSIMPFGDNPAFRMNLMTAIFGVMSVIALYRLASLLTSEYVFSFFAALAFAFARTEWSQSVTTEVYTLNNLVVCVAVILIILAAKSTRKSHLFIAAFFSGLSLTTHQTSLLILPASIWFLVQSGALPLKKGAMRWLGTILFFLVGFAFYLYLPIAASRHPVMNWGDPSTFQNFMKTLLAPAFTQVNQGVFSDHLIYLVQILFRELTPIGAILAIIGLFASLGKSASRMNKYLAWIILTYMLFFLITLRPVFINLYKLDVYYLPVFMFLCPMIVAGIKYLEDKIHGRWPIQKSLLIPVTLVIILIVPIWSLAGNWTVNDRSQNRLAEWYGRELLESCEKDSILLCNFDDLFILFYLQEVTGVRPDVSVVLAHFPARDESDFWKKWIYDELRNNPRVKTKSSGEMFYKSLDIEKIMETFIDENIASRPVYFSFYKMPMLELKEVDYRFEPKGLCYKVQKSGQDIDVLDSNYEYFNLNFKAEFFNDLFKKHHNDEEDFILVRCDEIFRFNAVLFHEFNDMKKALFFIELATAVNPHSVDDWMFKARIEESLGMSQEAVNSIDKIIEYETLISGGLSPAALDWRYEQARIFHRAGMDLQAADILNQYYRFDPRKPQAIQDLSKEVENALKEDENKE